MSLKDKLAKFDHPLTFIGRDSDVAEDKTMKIKDVMLNQHLTIAGVKGLTTLVFPEENVIVMRDRKNLSHVFKNGERVGRAWGNKAVMEIVKKARNLGEHKVSYEQAHKDLW